MSVVIPFSLQAAVLRHAPQETVAADARHALVGCWRSRDPAARTVVFTIRPAGPGLGVTAVDSQDGEEAEVSAVASHGQTVSFRLRWRSSGRICQCALQAVAPDSVQYTYTYVEHEVLERRSA
jgi:hypothetical protein